MGAGECVIQGRYKERGRTLHGLAVFAAFEKKCAVFLIAKQSYNIVVHIRKRINRIFICTFALDIALSEPKTDAKSDYLGYLYVSLVIKLLFEVYRTYKTDIFINYYMH